MFCDLWISNSFASFFDHQGQNIQSSNLSDFEKKVSVLSKQKKFFIIEKVQNSKNDANGW